MAGTNTATSDLETVNSIQHANRNGDITTTDDRETGSNWPGSRNADQSNNISSNTNVGDIERWASIIGGTALLVSGLRKGDLPGVAISVLGGGLLWRGVTGHCSLYQSMNINTAGGSQKGVHVVKSISIARPVSEVYWFWRRLENLPRIMKHLESVTETDSTRSHWKAKAPIGQTVEWDAEIINVRENELIAWRSVGKGDVDNAGSVAFHPTADGTGTEVKVTIQYNPPGGTLGAQIAHLFGEEPSLQVEDDLKRFKQLMESGE